VCLVWVPGWDVVVGVDRRNVIGPDRFIGEGFVTPSDRQ